MKTDIFTQAIRSRKNLKFLYESREINLEPYYLARNRMGKKVIYGKLKSSNEIREYEYDKIANIRIIESFRFSPRIPINSFAV